MKSRLAALATSAALLLAGCDLAPPYKAPTVVVPVSYRDRTIWHTATPADTMPRSDWWAAFNQAELDRLEGELVARNFTLASAAATYDQARANAAAARSGLFPQINAGGVLSYNRQSLHRPLRSPDQPTFYGANTVGAAVGYEVDLWDQIHNQVVAGKAAAQASAADLAFIRLSLQAELANDYLLLRGLDAQAKLLENTVTAYRHALDVVQNRFRGLIASGVDVSRAQTELESARAQLDNIRGRRALAEHAIATLVSVPAPAFSLPRDPTEIRMPPLPRGIPSVLLQRRPDIAGAERRVAAANADIGVARAAFYPNITLNALGGFQSTALSIFNLPNSIWSLGPGLTLPIFRGGLLRAEEAAAVAQYNLAAANYRGTVLTAFQEVEDALAQLHWLGSELVDDQRAVAAAQRTLDMAMALFVDGASSYLEVAVAQEQLLGAQELLLELQTQYLQSGVQLIRALGGGWSDRELPAPDSTPLLHVDLKP
ncbi:MAG: efflux transporter outer membrane subunit [Alphaproteobacteria bacterium]|nr:efflux transporter outer membrane subunit [Alphaproteobacteria bacterium]